MLSVKLPKKLETQLDRLAEKTHRTKSYYIRRALEEFFNDEEYYRIAIERLNKKNPRIPLEEVEKEIGLAY